MKNKLNIRATYKRKKPKQPHSHRPPPMRRMERKNVTNGEAATLLESEPIFADERYEEAVKMGVAALREREQEMSDLTATISAISQLEAANSGIDFSDRKDQTAVAYVLGRPAEMIIKALHEKASGDEMWEGEETK